MEFLQRAPRRKRGAIAPRALILAVAGISLAIFGVTEDATRGKALVSDAFAFTLVYVTTACFLEWLPALWRGGPGNGREALATPAFLAMIILYLYFAFRALFIQPTAAGIAIMLQLFVMIVLSCRTDD